MQTTDIRVSSWRDLAVFGIELLTGESCRFSQRLLCDLNESGRALMAEYLGINRESFLPAWNTQVNGESAVACVMLHRDSLRQIAEFAMMNAGALALVRVGNQDTLGLFSEESLKAWETHIESLPEHQLVRNFALASQTPGVGSRNKHMVTGRVA